MTHRYDVFTHKSQSQRLLRSSLPAADLTAEMETLAQRCGSMDDQSSMLEIGGFLRCVHAALFVKTQAVCLVVGRVWIVW